LLAAAIGAALRWPGDIAANAIIPLTLIALYADIHSPTPAETRYSAV
jgi:hypothetical protein